VQTVCDHKQGYTQFGGLRPYGVSLLFAGWYVNSEMISALSICWVGIYNMVFSYIKVIQQVITAYGR
jgi:20S proteasome alpha/beta subunit